MLGSVRIIAGIYRSRRLEAPAGLATRPSSDRLRETLFNVLAPRIEDAVFLDLYAGSGAVALEALSRGAARVELIEKAPAALKILRGNFAKLGIHHGFRIHEGAVAPVLRRMGQRAAEKADALPARFDLVFLDPPYDAQAEYAATLGLLGSALAALLAPHALVIAEHRRKDRLDQHYGALDRTRLLEQGDAALSFFAQTTLSDPASPSSVE
jgi:16S rRNA (guanine(966)-N(2))-methyltransferase RsmD